MALPANWSIIPITGTFLGINDTPIQGTITFEFVQSVSIGNTVIVPKIISTTLDANGEIPAGFSLPSTDDPDLNITTGVYHVVETFDGETPKEYAIKVPHDVASLDLSTVDRLIPAEEWVSSRGPQGVPGVVQEVVAGANVTVDNTDPTRPVVASAGGGGGGGVDQTYVDNQDAATLTSANTYTDQAESDAVAAAGTAADAGDASTLASAQTYADNGDSTTLASANSYADTQDAATLAAAQAYTDASAGGVTQAYVDAADAATLQAAKDYVDSQALGPNLTIPFGTWETTGAVPPTQDAGTNTAHFVNVTSIGSVKYVTTDIAPNTEYETTFTLSNYVEGAAQVCLYSEDGALGHLGTQRNANGTYTERVITNQSAGLANQIRIRTVGEGTFDVSDFTVREVSAGGGTGGGGSGEPGEAGPPGAGAFLDATQYIQAGDNGDITLAINRAFEVSLNVGLTGLGPYDMNTDLIMRDGMRLSGTAWASSGSSPTAAINCNNGASVLNGNSTRKNIHIQKLKFYGPGPGGSARAISGGFGGVVEECYFEGFDVCIGNGSSYLSRYFRNSFNDCNIGLSIADGHGTRFQDNFSAGDCKTFFSILHEPVIQVGVGSNKGTPMIMDGNNVSQGTAGGTGNVGMYLEGNITGRGNYFEDYSISPSGNTFVELLVGRFDSYGFQWFNNEMNGQGEAAHAMRIYGSHNLECRANGIIAHNRMFGFSGNAIQFGTVADPTLNYISHLRIFDNGASFGNEVTIGNFNPNGIYRPTVDVSFDASAAPIAIPGATWVDLPINSTINVDTAEGSVGNFIQRIRKTGYYDLTADATFQTTASDYPNMDLRLTLDGALLKLVDTGMMYAGATTRLNQTISKNHFFTAGQDVKLQARGGESVVAGSLQLKWSSSNSHH